MSKTMMTGAALAGMLLAGPALAEITFYEGEEFRGRAFTTDRQEEDFRSAGFNDKASSVIVDSGRWEVCEDAGYRGKCVLLRPGNYESLKQMGLNNRVSSARRGNDGARYDHEPEPLPEARYEYRRRPNERVYEAEVTSVRAVMGRDEKRCWVERERTGDGGRNVAGGVIGGIIGGVLDHQIGSGRGNDVATIGGAVAGAAAGSSVGRDRGARDVRRCEADADGRPEYWDVTYRFRGQEHYIQMTEPPGKHIHVNERGEPRQ
jgi:uncharacterized protein YcfJ